VQWVGGSTWVVRHARWLEEVPSARVPFIEVRRLLQWWRALGFTQAALIYERQNVWYDSADAFADRVLMQPLPFWERWLLAFRAVQEDGEASECRW
jgi:hypothetical protein